MDNTDLVKRIEQLEKHVMKLEKKLREVEIQAKTYTPPVRYK